MNYSHFKSCFNVEINTYHALTCMDGLINALVRGSSDRRLIVGFVKNEVPTWLKRVRCENDIPLTIIKDLNVKRKYFYKNKRIDKNHKMIFYTIPGPSALSALFLARSVLEVLNDNIPNFHDKFKVKDQLQIFNHTRVWTEEQFIPFTKYMTAYPIPKVLKGDNPLPPKPEGFSNHPLVFSGPIKRFLKSRLVCRNYIPLWYAYLQGIKRGCASVSQNFVKQAMIKHREVLTTEPAPIAEDSRLTSYFERFWKNFKAPEERLYEASTSASYQRKRDMGGAREEVRGHFGGLDLVHVLDREKKNKYFFQLHTDELQSMRLIKNKVHEMRGVTLPRVSDVIYEALESERKVGVQAVLEPLKVRLITKGDSLRYWLSRFYQKGMFRYLARMPQFSLIANPLNQTDLYDLIKREEKVQSKYYGQEKDIFQKWVSGDYSGATDSLNLNFTKLAFEKSLEKTNYSKELNEVLRSVLYEQEVYYPNLSGVPKGMQQNGQLMGSILSFPILCVVNLVCYWAALEQYLEMKVRLVDLPVLINGDDILFRSNTKLYDIWYKNITEVGFKLSLGKNYIDKTCLTVNSEMFIHNTVMNTFKKLPYLNTGLLIGKSKTNRESDTPIWDMYNKVVHTSNDPLRTHRRFLHHNKEKLSKITNKGLYNLFLPREFGGLGFEPPKGLKYEITSFQRRFASYYYNKLLTGIKENRVTWNGIKMISVSDKQGLSVPHYHEIRLQPKIGPLPENYREYEEHTIDPSILSSVQYETETKFILPRESELKEYRLQHPGRLPDKKIRPFRICEVINRPSL